jgi:hypothetical protein
MKSLSTEYQRSWTGRGRRAWTIGKGGLVFLKDFLRWLERYVSKGDQMVLQKTIESEHLTILIFRNDDCEKSMVRYVAETILALGDDPAGVPTEALHYCVPSHPFSSMQRLRELVAAYRRQWPGMHPNNPLGQLDRSITHVFKKNRYFFNYYFLQWLRASLPEIEKICYPVQTKKRLPIDIDKNKV